MCVCVCVCVCVCRRVIVEVVVVVVVVVAGAVLLVAYSMHAVHYSHTLVALNFLNATTRSDVWLSPALAFLARP